MPKNPLVLSENLTMSKRQGESMVLHHNEAYHCGYRDMTGKLCRAPAVRMGMCHVHKELKNKTRGFYAKTLTEEEKIEWDRISVGELDNEIKLAKVQLRRVLEKQMKPELVLTKIVTDDDGGSETQELPNFQDHINKLMSTINRLEKTRAEINHLVTAVHDEGVQGFRDRLAQMEDEMEGDPELLEADPTD